MEALQMKSNDYQWRPSFLEHFADIDASNAVASGRALAARQQVIIEDINKEPDFRLGLEWAVEAGFRKQRYSA
jgi:hypothetical protein